MTDDRRKYEPRPPRQMFVDKTTSSRLRASINFAGLPQLDNIEPVDASQIVEVGPIDKAAEKARKALRRAETAAKPLAKPRKAKKSKKARAAKAASQKGSDELLKSDASPNKPRRRKPGAGRKRIRDYPWEKFDPPMSRSAWYRNGRPNPPEANHG